MDGFGGRWVAVVEDDYGRRERQVHDSFDALIADRRLRHIVIDVPIGLPERGARDCDVEARRMIGPRRSSVFPAPIRPMLKAKTYREACRIGARLEGRRCSRQTFAILPVIREVDERMSPRLQRRVREGHPEVSFAALLGRTLRFPKRDPRGFAVRVAALANVFPGLEREIEEFPTTAGLLDFVDAHGLLWSARRVAAGEAGTLPSRPPRDAHGLRTEIVY